MKLILPKRIGEMAEQEGWVTSGMWIEDPPICSWIDRTYGFGARLLIVGDRLVAVKG